MLNINSGVIKKEELFRKEAEAMNLGRWRNPYRIMLLVCKYYEFGDENWIKQYVAIARNALNGSTRKRSHLQAKSWLMDCIIRDFRHVSKFITTKQCLLV
jgi:hypothetical protein